MTDPDKRPKPNRTVRHKFAGLPAEFKIVRVGQAWHTNVASTPDHVSAYLNWMRFEEVENFVVMFVDAKRQIRGHEVISRGSISGTLVHSREVFRLAIAHGASGVIVAHNHPSGDVRPSPEDLEVTAGLVRSGKIIGIPVIDHVILGNGFYSFASKGQL
jgi:DNA repair protein RadC